MLVSIIDLCVKVMCVRMREAPILAQGNDLGAAVGPLLGYVLLQVGLPPSVVLATQSLIHGAAVAAAAFAPSVLRNHGAHQRLVDVDVGPETPES